MQVQNTSMIIILFWLLWHLWMILLIWYFKCSSVCAYPVGNPTYNSTHSTSGVLCQSLMKTKPYSNANTNPNPACLTNHNRNSRTIKTHLFSVSKSTTPPNSAMFTNTLHLELHWLYWRVRTVICQTVWMLYWVIMWNSWHSAEYLWH